MLHTYHAQMVIQERDRRLRKAGELARLHREATDGTGRRPRWARRRRGADAPAQPEPRPSYALRPSP